MLYSFVSIWLGLIIHYIKHGNIKRLIFTIIPIRLLIFILMIGWSLVISPIYAIATFDNTIGVGIKIPKNHPVQLELKQIRSQYLTILIAVNVLLGFSVIKLNSTYTDNRLMFLIIASIYSCFILLCNILTIIGQV